MSTTNKKEKVKASHWVDIRKTLYKCSQHDLLSLIADLYELSQSNKNFLEARFLRDCHVLEDYKSQLKKYLAPREPWKEN